MLWVFFAYNAYSHFKSRGIGLGNRMYVGIPSKRAQGAKRMTSEQVAHISACGAYRMRSRMMRMILIIKRSGEKMIQTRERDDVNLGLKNIFL